MTLTQDQSKKHHVMGLKRNLILVLVVPLILLGLMFILTPTKAAAVNWGAIPSDIQQSLENYDELPNNCDSSGIKIYVKNVSWIWPTGQPSQNDLSSAATAIQVTPNQMINFSLINLSFSCHLVTPGQANNILTPANEPADDIVPTWTNTCASFYWYVPGDYPPCELEYQFGQPMASTGSVSGVSGPNPQQVAYQPGTRYWFPQPSNQGANMTWTAPPGGLSTTQPTAITINVPITEANYFQEVGNPGDQFYNAGAIYQCVDGDHHFIDNVVYANPQQGDLEVGNCASIPVPYTFWVIGKPATDNQPPKITIGASCDNRNVTGTASDADAPAGTTYSVSWSSTNGGGGGVVSTNSAGSYSIDMSSVDQYLPYTVTVTTADLNSDGAPGGKAPATNAVTYGPCYTLACGTNTITPAADPEGAADGLTPGAAFTDQANVSINPQPPPANRASLGVLTIYFNGAGGSPDPLPLGQTTGIANFTAPNSPGLYSYGFSYSIPGGPSVNCPNSGQKLVAYEPFFSVRGGDVLTGANQGGFNSPSCGSNTTSGALGYNKGASVGNEGAGTNLAITAPSLIYGFASKDGVSGPGSATYNTTVGESYALTFANVATSNSDANFGGGFGAGGQGSCTTNYYSVASQVLAAPNPEVAVNAAAPNPSDCITNNNTTYCWVSPAGGGVVKISGANLSNSLVIFVAGNAEITNNITFSNAALAQVSQIPSFYLVASGNIYINSNVSEVDGVYVAQPASGGGGQVYTCTNGTANTDVFANCQTPLNVNGSIVADQIKFERSYGSIGGSPGVADAPSEVFNYSPNIWMQNPFNSGGVLSGNPDYESITALPPVL